MSLGEGCVKVFVGEKRVEWYCIIMESIAKRESHTRVSLFTCRKVAQRHISSNISVAWVRSTREEASASLLLKFGSMKFGNKSGLKCSAGTEQPYRIGAALTSIILVATSRCLAQGALCALILCRERVICGLYVLNSRALKSSTAVQ